MKGSLKTTEERTQGVVRAKGAFVWGGGRDRSGFWSLWEHTVCQGPVLSSAWFSCIRQAGRKWQWSTQQLLAPHPPPPTQKHKQKSVPCVVVVLPQKQSMCEHPPPFPPPLHLPPPQTQIDALSAVGLAQDEICNMASISVVSV